MNEAPIFPCRAEIDIDGVSNPGIRHAGNTVLNALVNGFGERGIKVLIGREFIHLDPEFEAVYVDVGIAVGDDLVERRESILIGTDRTWMGSGEVVNHDLWPLSESGLRESAHAAMERLLQRCDLSGSVHSSF